MNTNIIRQAEDIKNKISEAIDDVRESAMYIDAILENKDKLELALMGAGKTIYLAQIMTPEQMKEVMDYITSKISDSQAERETRLMMLINPGQKDEGHDNHPEKESESEKEDDKKRIDVNKAGACNDANDCEKKDSKVTAKSKKLVIETARTKIVNNTKKCPLPESEEEEYLRENYIKNNKKVEEIASDLGVGKTWVYERIKKYKLREQKSPEWNIEEVKKLLKSGKTVKDIAEIYGIDKKEAYKKMAADGVSPSTYKD